MKLHLNLFKIAPLMILVTFGIILLSPVTVSAYNVVTTTTPAMSSGFGGGSSTCVVSKANPSCAKSTGTTTSTPAPKTGTKTPTSNVCPTRTNPEAPCGVKTSPTTASSCTSGFSILGSIPFIGSALQGIQCFMVAVVTALDNPSTAIADILGFMLGVVASLPITIGNIVGNVIPDSFLLTIYDTLLPYGFALLGIGALVRFIQIATKETHVNFVSVIWHLVLGASILAVGGKVLIWAMDVSNLAAGDMVTSISKGITAHMSVSNVITSYITTISPINYFKGLAVLIVIIMMIYIFFLMLLRAGMLVLMIGIAPLFIPMGVYSMRNKFAQTFFDLFVANLLIPIIAGIGLTISFALMEGLETVNDNVIGTAMSSMVGPLIAIFVLMATSHLIKVFAKGAMGAGGGLGAVATMAVEAIGLAVGVASGGLALPAVATSLAGGLKGGAGTQHLASLGANAGGTSSTGKSFTNGGGGGAGVGNNVGGAGGGVNSTEQHFMDQMGADPETISLPNCRPLETMTNDPQAQEIINTAVRGTSSVAEKAAFMAANPNKYGDLTKTMMQGGTYKSDVLNGKAPSETRFNFSQDEMSNLMDMANNINKE